MKKLRSLAVILLVLSLVFTACSPAAKEAMDEGDKTTSSEANESKSEEKKDETASDKPVEIQFWYGLGSVAGETMEEIIKEHLLMII